MYKIFFSRWFTIHTHQKQVAVLLMHSPAREIIASFVLCIPGSGTSCLQLNLTLESTIRTSKVKSSWPRILQMFGQSFGHLKFSKKPQTIIFLDNEWKSSIKMCKQSLDLRHIIWEAMVKKSTGIQGTNHKFSKKRQDGNHISYKFHFKNLFYNNFL